MEKHSFPSFTPSSFPRWLFASVTKRDREVTLAAAEKHMQISGQSESLTTKASELASPALAMTTRPQ